MSAATKLLNNKPARAGMGRPKGSPNKVGVLVKEAIVAALHTARVPAPNGKGTVSGAIPYLRWLAIHEPKAFATLVGKVMPTQITGEDGKAITINVDGKDASLL